MPQLESAGVVSQMEDSALARDSREQYKWVDHKPNCSSERYQYELDRWASNVEAAQVFEPSRLQT